MSTKKGHSEVPGVFAKRICKAAFAAGLLRDGLPAPEALPRREALARAKDAWGRGDRSAYVAAARSARAAGPLSAEHDLRLAQALFETGLDLEALAILLDPARQDPGPSGERSRLLGEIWLRLGATGPAATALGEGLALGAGANEQKRIKTLQRGLSARAGQLPADWIGICALARALLALEHPDQACAVLGAGLQRDGETAAASVDAILECAFAALRTASGGAAAGLLAAMAPLYLANDEGPAWLAAMAELHGRSEPWPVPAPRNWQLARKLHACLAAALAAAGCWRAAIQRCDPPVKAAELMTQSLTELARYVGRHVTSDLDLAFLPPAQKPRVFDVFPFNGEFAKLELKLASMASWVDGFVIVEAGRTFTGRPQPLRFAERASDFAHVKHKIIHAPLEDFPPYLGTAWAREFFQRDQAALALKGRCSPDDIVIISDADEIVRREVVEGFQGLFAGAELDSFRYFFNCQDLSDRNLIKAGLARARLLTRNGLSYLRLGGLQYKNHTIPDAGWHFTSIGSAEELERKFRSFSHQDWAHLGRDDFVELLRQVRAGELGPDLRARPLEDMPDFIRERRDALAQWLL